MIRITTDRQVKQEIEKAMNSHYEREELNQRYRDMMSRIYELEKRVSKLEGTNRIDGRNYECKCL